MQPGIYYDIDSRRYHTGPGISKSGLDLIRKSPRHYFDKYLAGQQPAASDPTVEDEDGEDRPPAGPPDDDTEAKLYGRAIHSLVLEPQNFEREFTVSPKFGRKKDDLAAKAAWKEANRHRTIVTDAQVKDMLRMRDGIQAHPAASKLLSMPGWSEVSVYWTDPETGVLCRCRPDRLTASGIIIDLKSSGFRNASPDGFSRMANDRRYHVQSAFYTDGCRAAGIDVKGFVYVMVERETGYVGCYSLEPDSVDFGQKSYREDLATFAACTTSQTWPGYGDRVHKVSLPSWALRAAGY